MLAVTNASPRTVAAQPYTSLLLWAGGREPALTQASSESRCCASSVAGERELHDLRSCPAPALLPSMAGARGAAERGGGALLCRLRGAGPGVHARPRHRVAVSQRGRGGAQQLRRAGGPGYALPRPGPPALPRGKRVLA